MKKLSLIISLCFFGGGLYAQYPSISKSYPSLVNVINAYHYNKSLGDDYRNIVPLFLPYYGCPDHLQIYIYDVVEYYGEKIKATEYPKDVIDVYYNRFGYLDKIEHENRDYIFRYDYDGELNRRDCYDKLTGSTLNSYVRKINEYFLSSSTESIYSNGNYYYINWDDTPYFTHGHTLFLEVSYVDGISASYYIAKPNDKMGENMYFSYDGFHFNKKKMREIAPYWRDYGPMKYADRFLKEDLKYGVNWDYEYNEIGLRVGEGIELWESKHYAIKIRIMSTIG